MSNTDRFTNRAENYAKYRPSYPEEFINYLVTETGLNKNSVAADIGAGTGILTRLLADKVKKIYAVEPNRDMLAECRKYLKGIKNCSIIEADAENTTLADRSVDLITVAQAFHWFDREKAKTEFRRILKESGKVIIVWNIKPLEDDFFRENSLLFKKFCPAFKGFTGGADTGEESFSDFFKERACSYRVFDNSKSLNLKEFTGGTLSASYSLAEGDQGYEEYISELTALFSKYSSKGILRMPLKTCCYIGEI